MRNLIELVNDWEIQLLVLLSFGLQMFLFFVGGFRRRSTNMFLRLSIWLAYLGADLVAVYALGYLSRHSKDTTNGRDTCRINSLAFFWAPFLIVHLGGQDTITAFAMEDNNLWLRHLLNLVVQFSLVLYVFWNSIGRHRVDLLISGIFVSLTGIIKYGERTWSLKCGRSESLESSTGSDYKHQLPKVNDGDDDYSKTIYTALQSMPYIFEIFAAHVISTNINLLGDLKRVEDQQHKNTRKVLAMEIGMMYDDLYTKALVLRKKSGIIFRCISGASALVAFVIFLVSDKQSYRGADIAITYTLFIGGFFLNACAMFIFIMSPWTWAWLKARGCNKLARVSRFFSTINLVGWQDKRPLMWNTTGQYNLMGWLYASSDQPWSCNRPVMNMARKLVTLVGGQEEKLFWMSKLLDTEYIEADKMLECLLEGVSQFAEEDLESQDQLQVPFDLFHIEELELDFGRGIVGLHILTEIYLSGCSQPDVETKSLLEVCRKLSRYMMYLLITHPSLLPLNVSALSILEECKSKKDQFMREVEQDVPQLGTQALEEIKKVWMRFAIYAAARSRPQTHAALLARGGEPLTFVWLLLAHHGMGDLTHNRIELTNLRSEEVSTRYALRFPEENNCD